MADSLSIDGDAVRDLAGRLAAAAATARLDARAVSVDVGALASEQVVGELQRSSALREMLVATSADLLGQLAVSARHSADEFDSIDRQLAGGAYGGMVAN